ncbi:MAG: hypothetical protein P8K79_07245 [Mariniblastus sp.]|nr:hypothetical protein [Mariniblastus sp.]
MNFTLRQLIVFTTMVCLAVALTQISPVFGFAALIFVLGAACFLLERVTWQVFLCCALFGIGIYTVSFVIVAECLAPPETLGFRTRGNSEHRSWIAATKPLQHHTAIPIGALLGLLFGIGFKRFREMRNRPIQSVHRYLIYAAVFVSTIGIVGAVDSSFDLWYTMGKLLVFDFAGDVTGTYPPRPDRWFAFHLNHHYLAISYPLLIGVVLLLVGTFAWTIKRNKQPVPNHRITDG